ncbi:SPOR domain-containing protein [Aestuariibius insulae]|uniref:SPOR domain-containing protein n=1 Tax=Aestuariibius insulae TaxID=2058287 RepID=UPI00345E19E4
MAITRLIPMTFACLALAGCEDGFSNPFTGSGSGGETAAAAPAGGSTESVTRDVEAPEIFEATDSGLWDGRPSLGGIWVAHPDVQDAERVIIRNTENNTNVTGALFRRERNNPGPTIQVSSDAAEALGMIAGQPAQLSVVALKTETVEVVTDAPAPLEEGVDDLAAPSDVSVTPLDGAAPGGDPIAGAAAAIDAAEASATPAPAPAPAAQTAASGSSNPVIQTATFRTERNANAAAASLRAAGLTPAVLRGDSGGTPVFRVVVPNIGTGAERAALLEQVKATGFTDAYIQG